ncbi:GATA zinc finger domain-containing protein 15-like [Solanum tuberosum]|uniref:GATA zinc finger domain-containing protein 15-like n=1 Tax=Solanum tuberosum TaxID=4113 RepID=UPI00073A418A|nr:PREDICTED: GATA zinc finger domain-containing protein 15-like [Solanum tuberosum]
MEFFSNHLSFFFFLLITLLSSCQVHARDSQFFNKIHTTNINNDHIEKETKVVVTPNKNQEPNFIPKNENAYDVYGHELGQLPPSTPTTNLIPNNKYLPKNYNSVAYVTVPQYNTDETNTMNSNNQRYNSGRGISSDHDHYYIGDNTYNNNNNNEYYINGNTYDHYYKSDNNDDNNNNNNQYYNSVNTYNDQYHNGGRAGSKVMTTSTVIPKW